MNHTTAAPVILTVSLMLLVSGSIGAAAQDRGVRDTRGPAATGANAAIVGLARGEVIRRIHFSGVPDDLSPLVGLAPVLAPAETPSPTPTIILDVVDVLSPLRGGD